MPNRGGRHRGERRSRPHVDKLLAAEEEWAATELHEEASTDSRAMHHHNQLHRREPQDLPAVHHQSGGLLGRPEDTNSVAATGDSPLQTAVISGPSSSDCPLHPSSAATHSSGSDRRGSRPTAQRQSGDVVSEGHNRIDAGELPHRAREATTILSRGDAPRRQRETKKLHASVQMSASIPNPRVGGDPASTTSRTPSQPVTDRAAPDESTCRRKRPPATAAASVKQQRQKAAEKPTTVYCTTALGTPLLSVTSSTLQTTPPNPKDSTCGTSVKSHTRLSASSRHTATSSGRAAESRDGRSLGDCRRNRSADRRTRTRSDASSSTGDVLHTSPASLATYSQAFCLTLARRSWLSSVLSLGFHLIHVLLAVALFTSPVFLRSVVFASDPMSRTLMHAQGYGKAAPVGPGHPTSIPSSRTPITIESVWAIHDVFILAPPDIRVVAAPIEENFMQLQIEDSSRGVRKTVPAAADDRAEEQREAASLSTVDEGGVVSVAYTFVSQRRPSGDGVASLVSQPPPPEKPRLPNRQEAGHVRRTIRTAAAAWKSSPLYSSPLALTLYYYMYVIGCLLILFVVSDGRLTGHLSVWRLLIGGGELLWFIHHGGHSFLTCVLLLWLPHRRPTMTTTSSLSAPNGEAMLPKNSTPYLTLHRDTGDIQFRWFYWLQEDGGQSKLVTGDMHAGVYLYEDADTIVWTARAVTGLFLALIILCVMKDLHRLLEAVIGVRVLAEPEGLVRCPLCGDLMEASPLPTAHKQQQLQHASSKSSRRGSPWRFYWGMLWYSCAPPLLTREGFRRGDTDVQSDAFYYAEVMSTSAATMLPSSDSTILGASLRSSSPSLTPGAAHTEQSSGSELAHEDSSEEDEIEGGIVTVLRDGDGHASTTRQGGTSVRRVRHRCSKLYLDAPSAKDSVEDSNTEASEEDFTNSHRSSFASLTASARFAGGVVSGAPGVPPLTVPATSRRRAITTDATTAFALPVPSAGALSLPSSSQQLLSQRSPLGSPLAYNYSFAAIHLPTSAMGYGTMQPVSHRLASAAPPPSSTPSFERQSLQLTGQTPPGGGPSACGTSQTVVNRAVYEPIRNSDDEFRPGNAFPSYEKAMWLSRLLYTWVSPLATFALIEAPLLRNEQFLPSLPEYLTALDNTAIPLQHLWVNRKLWFRTSITSPGMLIPTADVLDRAEEAALPPGECRSPTESEEEEENSSDSGDQTVVVLGKKPLTNARLRALRPRRGFGEKCFMTATAPIRWFGGRLLYHLYVGNSQVLRRAQERLVRAFLRDRLMAAASEVTLSYAEQVESSVLLAAMTSSSDDEGDRRGSTGSMLKPHLRRQLALHDVSVFTVFLEHRCGRRFIFSAGPLLLVAHALSFVGVFLIAGLVHALTQESEAIGVTVGGEEESNKKAVLVVDTWKCLLWCGALCGTLLLRCVVKQWYCAQVQEASMETTAAVRTLVLDKVLSFPLAQRTFRSNAEIIHLAAVEAVTVGAALMTLHQTWSIPLCVLASVGFLAFFLHWTSTVAAFTTFCVAVPLIRRCSALLRHRERGTTPCPMSLIMLLEEMVLNLRLVKAQLLEGSYRQCFTQLRAGVLVAQRGVANALILRGVVTAVSMLLMGFLAIVAAYATVGPDVLEAARMIPALALMMLLWSPLTSLPLLFHSVTLGYLAMKRIEGFLRQSPDVFVSTWVDLTMARAQGIEHPRGSVVCAGCSFTWQHDLTDEVPDPELVAVSMGIAPSELVVIQGPTGTGKTTLLLSMLGETNRCVSSGSSSAHGGHPGVDPASLECSVTCEVAEELATAAAGLHASPPAPPRVGNTGRGDYLWDAGRDTPCSPHTHSAQPESTLATAASPHATSSPDNTASAATEGFLVFGNCAYCAEEPWLQNDTVKANIVSGIGSGFVNMKWYRRVLRACALDKDLAEMPLGDATVIGEKGVALTKSQQVRIALARAVFLDADIYLLDSLLTFLNPPTQKHIIREVIHKLLRKKTVIMATNVGLVSLRPHRIFTIVAGGGHVREDTHLFHEVDDDGETSSSSADRHTVAGPTRSSPWVPSVHNTGSRSAKSVTRHDAKEITVSNHPVVVTLPTLYDEAYEECAGGARGSGAAAGASAIEAGSAFYNVATTAASPVILTNIEERGVFDDDDDASVFHVEVGRHHALYTSPHYGHAYRQHDLLGREIIPESSDARRSSFADARASFLEDSGAPAVSSYATPDDVRTPWLPTLSMFGANAAVDDGMRLRVPDGGQTLHTLLLFMGRQSGWLILLSGLQTALWLGMSIWTALWIAMPVWLPPFLHSNAVFLAIAAVAGAASAVLLEPPLLWVAFQALVGTLHGLYQEILLKVLRSASTTVPGAPPLSQILRVLVHDVTVVESTLPQAMDVVLSGLMQLSVVALFNSLMNPVFLLLIPVVSALYVSLTVRYATASKELRRLERRSLMGTMAILAEALRGAPTVRCFGLEDRIREEYCRTIDTHSTAVLTAYMVERWATLRLHLLTLLMVIAVGIGGILLSPSAVMTPSYTGIGLLLGLRTGPVLASMCYRVGGLQAEWSSLRRLLALLGLPAEPATVPPVAPDDGPRPRPIPAVDLVNISVRYSKSMPWALRHVSLRIAPRERLGIIGKTGHGKSSIFSALLRLVEEVEGGVYLDGVDVNTIPYPELRDMCTLIPQAPLIPPSTWRSYLTSGYERRRQYRDVSATVSTTGSVTGADDPLARESALWGAVRAVGLADAVSFSGGLDSPIVTPPTTAENGALPVFQRQLLCLARAVLHRPRVVLLEDVAANAAESCAEVDAILQHVLRYELQNCTVLTIANRANTIFSLCTRVVMMEEGTIKGSLSLPQGVPLSTVHQFVALRASNKQAVASMIMNMPE